MLLPGGFAVVLAVILEPAHLEDLHAECLQPGQQPVQRRLILQRPMYDGFHRLHGCVQPPVVNKDFRREDSRYPDFIVEGCHRWATSLGEGHIGSTVRRSDGLRPTLDG